MELGGIRRYWTEFVSSLLGGGCGVGYGCLGVVLVVLGCSLLRATKV